MSSILQIAANRTNGSKSRGPATPEGKLMSAANSANSTGPTTPEGKAIASRNAIRHGMLAQSLVLDAESQEQFTALLGQLHEELQPQTCTEIRMVEVMAMADWRRMRLWCIETEQIANETRKQIAAGCEGAGQDPARCTSQAFRVLCDNSRILDVVNRYETRYDRQYLRILSRLEAKISKRTEPNPGQTT